PFLPTTTDSLGASLPQVAPSLVTAYGGSLGAGPSRWTTPAMVPLASAGAPKATSATLKAAVAAARDLTVPLGLFVIRKIGERTDQVHDLLALLGGEIHELHAHAGIDVVVAPGTER